MKHCNCKEITSSVNSKCVVCDGDMTWKHEKARKDFEKHVKKELKKKCKSCGSKYEHFMINCVSGFFCINKKCKNHKIPPGFFGPPSGPSISISPIK